MSVPVFYKDPNFNFSKLESGRTLTDASKSSMAFDKAWFSSLHGLDKILKSFHFVDKPFCKMAEIFSQAFMVSLIFNFILETHKVIEYLPPS